MSYPVITKSTPVLFVATIEPALDFWQRRLGFQRQAEVPEGDKLGFVILTNGTFEVMYQTISMLAHDVPALLEDGKRGRTFLFVEVADLAAVMKALEGCEIVMPKRDTFYGATEIGYREPGGHYVTFAQFKR